MYLIVFIYPSFKQVCKNRQWRDSWWIPWLSTAWKQEKAKCKLDYFTLQCRILSLKKRKKAMFQNNAVWVSSFLYHKFYPQWHGSHQCSCKVKLFQIGKIFFWKTWSVSLLKSLSYRAISPSKLLYFFPLADTCYFFHTKSYSFSLSFTGQQ